MRGVRDDLVVDQRHGCSVDGEFGRIRINRKVRRVKALCHQKRHVAVGLQRGRGGRAAERLRDVVRSGVCGVDMDAGHTGVIDRPEVSVQRQSQCLPPA